MTDDQSSTNIKVTDRRHFDKTGERRENTEIPTDPPAARATPPSPPASRPDRPAGASSGPTRGRGSGPLEGSAQSPDLSQIAAGLASSFSLLVARLAQETEIYLGLVPYPGKESAEPDLEAARAMIDILSMLQEKTRGNLDEEEAHLLENLLYTYRLEFVRLRPAGGAK